MKWTDCMVSGSTQQAKLSDLSNHAGINKLKAKAAGSLNLYDFMTAGTTMCLLRIQWSIDSLPGPRTRKIASNSPQ